MGVTERLEYDTTCVEYDVSRIDHVTCACRLFFSSMLGLCRPAVPALARALAPVQALRTLTSSAQAWKEAKEWTPNSLRTGLIARKKGMTTMFTPDGKRVPATVLYVDANQVSMHVRHEAASPEEEPYIAVQVAATDARENAVSAPVRGHLEKAGLGPKRVVREFRVSEDALVPLGTTLSAAHFVPGQDVDVRAITRGKGFAGVMKRHNFAGGNASHGASLAHRTPGSIGNNQDPGRVFPGKRMPGRMGGHYRTVQNVRVLRIDVKNELIFVKGQVPGPDGGVVVVRDALKSLVKNAYYTYRKGQSSTGELLDPAKGPAQYLPRGLLGLPFPAGTREMAASLPDVVEVGPYP